MSWTDEEIDKLFQESANELSFKYDNAYFKEFEAAALPVNKKGKDFLWMGTALVFIGVLTTGYLFTNGTESVSNKTAIQLAASVGMKNSPAATAQPSSENQTKSVNETSTSPLVANSGWKRTTGESKQAPAKARALNMSPSGTPSTLAIDAHQSGNPSTSSLGGNASTPATSTFARISTGATEFPAAIQLLENEIVQPASEKNLTKASTQVEAVSELTANKATGIDNTIEQEIATINMPPLGQITPKASLYLEVNGGISQSLITPSENFSSSYGAGFGVETHFRQFSLNTGLNLNVSNHQDLELTRSWKIYSFGSTMGMDNFDYKNVYAIEMPISMGYNFGKHRLTLGVRPSFVVGAKIDHQSFEGENLTRSERIYGMAGGLQRFGVKPMIGYSFHFQQKWTIGVNLGVQLMQAVNEDFINGFNNPFPIDGQIYLRRTIRLRNY